jgi:hypothetical protein
MGLSKVEKRLKKLLPDQELVFGLQSWKAPPITRTYFSVDAAL